MASSILKVGETGFLDRDELLVRLRERMVAFAASRVRRDVAEDLAQETLMVLENRYRQVESPDEALPLVFQILRYKMAGWRRKFVRRGEGHAARVEDLPLADPASDPEVQAERRELKEKLRAALAELGERCRSLLRMKLQGRSFEEIRRHFEVESINTIYTWDSRCRQELKAKLEGGER